MTSERSLTADHRDAEADRRDTAADQSAWQETVRDNILSGSPGTADREQSRFARGRAREDRENAKSGREAAAAKRNA